MKNIFLGLIVSLVGFTSVSALACDCGKKCTTKHEAACTEKGLKKGSTAFKACLKTEMASCGDGKCSKGADGTCGGPTDTKM